MAVDVIYSQKEELKKLLTKRFIPRDNLPVGKKALGHNLIKAITGPRRAGKSVYCLQILSSQSFAYLNFDSEEVLGIKSHGKIIEALESVYPEENFYFLDEIQNLPKWELFANTLQRRGKNLIITGSNANLLSGELATHLTGRYQEIFIYPFSFKEFMKAKQAGTLLLKNYLLTGGYPEVVMLGLEPKDYLTTLAEATIFRDVVRRYKIKYSAQLNNLVKLLWSSYTKQISLTNITKTTQIGSHHTINKYLDYIFQTYLLIPLERFHFKTKERIKSAKKVYFPDTGFASVNFSVTYDWEKLLENAVFMEYMRHGKKPGRNLFYYKTKLGKEVDFVLNPGDSSQELVQVCYDFSDPRTKKREISALSEAQAELKGGKKQIITLENAAEFLNS